MKQLIAALAFTLALQAGDSVARLPRPSGALIIDGRNVLASAAGRITVLAFVSTQCGRCAAAARVMQQASKEYPGAFFEAVAFDEGADAATWSKKFDLSFPVRAVDRAAALKFLSLDSADTRIATPQMVYIDKAGWIRAKSEPAGTPLLQTEDYMRILLNAMLKQAGFLEHGR